MKTEIKCKAKKINRKKITVSFFENIKQGQPKVASLIVILFRIKNGKFKKIIGHIKQYFAESEVKKAGELKANLPGVTFSATYNGGRRQENILEYNNLLVLDIDKISDRLLENKTLISKDPYTLAVWKSPSGTGLKVLVMVDSSMEDHKIAFQSLEGYYKQKFKLQIDKSGSDVQRLCFMSYDPNIFINWDAKRFCVEVSEINQDGIAEKHWKDTVSASKITEDIAKFLTGRNISITYNHERWYKVTLAIVSAIPNNKGKDLYLQLCRLDGSKHDENASIAKWNYCLNNYQNKITFKTLLYYAKEAGYDLTRASEIQNNTDAPIPLKPFIPDITPLNTPKSFNVSTFPEEVYNNLPNLLEQVCNLFTKQKERDIALLGSLTTLSILMPNINGTYNKDKVGMPLFLFVVAPASAGKGVLKYPKYLGHAIHQKLLEDGKRLFIPANCSASAVLKTINKNDGWGIIYETEADTLSLTMNNEWGNYSDFLRKVFHHESVSLLRVADDEYIDVLNPNVAVVLSGTPNQVSSLIPSAENGLFSRFAFYAFSTDTEWQDVFADNGNVDLAEYMKSLSEKLLFHYNKLNELEVGLTFKLTGEQQAQFNKLFGKWQNEFKEIVGEDLIASIRRLGLMAFRIAMILTTLRLMDEWGENRTEILCNDSDFEKSIKIVEYLRIHTMEIYSRFNDKQIKFNNNEQAKFFYNLPIEFSASEAFKIATNFKIKYKTAESYLSKFVKSGIMYRLKHGHYSKNKPA
ncbi:MAG: DUF3987 domain-containing protein [Bacteroidetes bacterium]|nr:DUF3987 domain-containing protein [Bacteroidota bacterium]HET6245383.1 DUF3987 domain-containing protein [Bacteroidia bacterium]